jgi:integrase
MLTRSLTEQLPKILKMELYFERKAKSPRTTRTYIKVLKELAKRGNLDNPLSIELAISRYKLYNYMSHKLTDKPASQRWKQQLCTVYLHYCKANGIQWEKPVYKADEHGIQPPSEDRIKQLITAAKYPLNIKIEISMQTGLRPIEIQSPKGLKMRDIHLDTKTIIATNTKGCTARPPMPISDHLATKLQELIYKNNLKPDDLLFSGEARNYPDHFRRLKTRLAKYYNDPTIKSIRLYDLRHYYVSKLLKQTQNTEIVRQKVGHKRLNTTQKYLHLLADTYSTEWIVESTNDKKRSEELIRSNYIYVLTTPDGYMQFKKPK